MNRLPASLIDSLKGVEGFDEEAFVAVHESGERVTSVRMNPSKTSYQPFDNMEPVPWSSNGYYLPIRPSFTLDPLLHAGGYYVQEASSMFLEQCLRQTIDLSRSLKVLDLCAAPGGKSTLIQSLISDQSLLVSNEVIKTRVNVLIENLSKWGNINCVVTNNDPKDFKRLENYFDVMVVDAPCSGSGLFRRDPSAIEEWSEEAVQTCSLRQQRILADSYPSLKNNGILIYSTCSYSVEEDEQICEWLTQNFDLSPMPLQLTANWNIVETSRMNTINGYRFFPNRLRGEGFFIACFRKNDGDLSCDAEVKRAKVNKLSPSEASVVRPWLKHPEAVSLYHLETEIFAFPEGMQQDLLLLMSNLYIRKAGVLIGRLIKDELLPAHEFALSNIISDEVVSISLNKEDALQYLRKEEININSEGKRGWALARYRNNNLGWIKLLGNRINNYYPKEWRILKAERTK